MAQLKNTTISDTGSIDLPVGTTAQRPGSPIAGMIRYNTTLSETEYYDGTAWRPLSDSNPEATGGTIVDTDIGGVPYRIHYFTNTGNSTFTVSKGGSVEYLIVAGGGGGGSKSKGSTGGTAGGGGGGAGGLLTGFTTVTPQTYTITVGAGGQGGGFPSGGGSTQNGGNGGNSSAFGLTSIGGGGGGRNGAGASSGGSGGGAGNSNLFGNGTVGQGNAGGSSLNEVNFYPRGGGGGAGSVGGSGSDSGGAGAGGIGLALSISGTTTFYAGGGGGSMRRGATSLGGGRGGLGGGQNGGIQSGSDIIDGFYGDNLPMPPGSPNTGGGGGGQAGSSVNLLGHGGFGGSGIVIVRYRRNQSTTTNPTRTTIATQPNNFQIISNGLVLNLDAANPVSYPGTGTVWQDLSSGGNNGTLVNGVGYSGDNFGSLVFDGVNDRIECGTFSVSFLTVSTWVYKTTSTSEQGICRKERGWAVSNYQGVLQVAPGTSWQFYNTGYTIPLNTWVNIVYTYSGTGATGSQTVYINGSSIYSTSAGSGAITANANPVRVGFDDNNWFWNGRIANTKIYNRPLAQSEVQQNFNALRGRYGI